jgi:hypothetical protein
MTPKVHGTAAGSRFNLVYRAAAAKQERTEDQRCERHDQTASQIAEEPPHVTRVASNRKSFKQVHQVLRDVRPM